MSAPGVFIAEGRPPIERPAAAVAFGTPDPEHTWDILADHLGVAAFVPIEVPEPVELLESAVPIAPAPIESVVARADQLPGEEKTRARYKRFLGGVAMHGSRVESPSAPRVARVSSLDILQNAANGDQEARAALKLDTRTHVAEIIGGVGESMEVELEVNAEGKVVWAGQDTEARQFQVLTTYTNQAPQIREAVHAEGLSGFRLEDRNQDGQLAGKRTFDFSAVPEASRKELSEWGYFLNSVGACIRDTSFQPGKCTVSSLFVAGVDQRKLPPHRPNETEADEIRRQEMALALRFDVRVFRKMYMKFGVEGAETMTPAEILDTPVTTPEGYDGIDMVMLYDSLAQDEVEEGVQTFFGSVELWQELGSPETLTRAHYETHIKAREARQQQNDELCDRIVDEQIARAHQASTPLEAVEMKRRVVLDFTVKEAAHDDSIDETRFGRIAAGYINAARQNYAAGNTEAGDKFTEKASEKAADPSCPPGERNKPGADKDKAPEGDHECNEVRDGDLVHCPYCDQNVRAIVPPPGEQIFCSNGQCEAAYVKSAKPKSGDVKSNSTAKFFQGLTPPKQKAKNDKT